MRLSRTKRNWDEFARADPLWAVLTEPEKRGNRWSAEEFFRTGEEAVAADLAFVREHLATLGSGRALDFGCGVGRLTQALAAHFARVTGVDISAGMIEHARRFNRHVDRVDYVVNTRDDLAQFPDRHFDFVYSLITLQHMEPVYARRYLAEFVRVAAPGGAILFQVPARRAARRRPFTLWPDTLLKRLWRDLRQALRATPVMEMHALSPGEVREALEAAGAVLLAERAHGTTEPGLDSRAYLARKP